MPRVKQWLMSAARVPNKPRPKRGFHPKPFCTVRIRSSVVMRSNAKHLAKPPGPLCTDPSPLTQDDGMIKDYYRHNALIRSLKVAIEVFTDDNGYAFGPGC